MTDQLTTFAPVIDRLEPSHPTGNLRVALPELDQDGRLLSIGVVSEAERGVVLAKGTASGLLAPHIIVNGVEQVPQLAWTRVACWLPRAKATLETGTIELSWVAPVSLAGRSDAGLVARLSYRNTSDSVQDVTLRWSGEWASTSVQHFRAKPVEDTLVNRDDVWTGSRAVYCGAGRLLLAISWHPGSGAAHDSNAAPSGWSCSRSESVAAGHELVVDVYLGVAVEPDGSGATSLHLRRRGFDSLHADTVSWLEHHGPHFDDRALEERARLNLFFCHFFAQGDCLDTGRTVLMTSRSPRYYVSGAFWSRDAYWWAFPALLLTDPVRARRALVESLRNAGSDIAQHALYVTGTVLYPGFELDELCSPVIAVWRYVDATGDRSVLAEKPVAELFAHVQSEIIEWYDHELGLYATFLLPTDDPAIFPFTATNNALVAVALQIMGRLAGDESLERRGVDLADKLASRFVHDAEDGRGPRWAWAVDSAGNPEWRDEPPLGLRTLRYWTQSGAALDATDNWLVTDYDFHYEGAFPGAGAPHFASPSSFDLGNRMLTDNHDLGDPVLALVNTPLDGGVACESWDPHTGHAVTGAAMASVAGFLAWTAWAHATGHRSWDAPFLLPLPGADPTIGGPLP
jgi:hypothetical protein